jgi:hypothetical protein
MVPFLSPVTMKLFLVILSDSEESLVTQLISQGELGIAGVQAISVYIQV